MAHKKTRSHEKIIGYRTPGGATSEVWMRRWHFLWEAQQASPDLTDSFLALQPQGQATAAALLRAREMRGYSAKFTKFIAEPDGVRGHTDWNELAWNEVEFETREILSHDQGATSRHGQPLMGADRMAVLTFCHELLKWQARWNLSSVKQRFTPKERLLEAIFHTPAKRSLRGHDDWILALAALELLNEDEPALFPRRWISSGGLGIPITASAEFEPWDGDERPQVWKARQLVRIENRLNEHLSERHAEAEEWGFEPIMLKRQDGLKHYRWAARWQVLSESWTDFLMNAGIQRKEPYVRRQIRETLAFIGIKPRPWM